MNENENLISEDMLDRLIELAVAKPSPQAKLIHAKPVLGEGEYLVHVDYAIPSFDELKKEFGIDHVSYIFDGRPFEKHPSCADIDETPGERVMLVKHFTHAIRSEHAIKAMDKLGYRPATHLELYAFQKTNPELQRQFWIIAPGSSAKHGGGPDVAYLYGSLDWRTLGGVWFGCWWANSDRLLFVRR